MVMPMSATSTDSTAAIFNAVGRVIIAMRSLQAEVVEGFHGRNPTTHRAGGSGPDLLGHHLGT
ncbi:hypothetical protein GCM10009779_55310 [Polymorphospora rubra]